MHRTKAATSSVENSPKGKTSEVAEVVALLDSKALSRNASKLFSRDVSNCRKDLFNKREPKIQIKRRAVPPDLVPRR